MNIEKFFFSIFVNKHCLSLAGTSMQKLQYEQVRYANGFVPVSTTFSYGQRSKCADLLNSYQSVSFRSKPDHGLRSRIVGVRSTKQSAGIKVGAKASTFDYNNYFPCCTCWISSNCWILSNCGFHLTVDFKISALFLRLSQRHSLGFAAHPQ